MGVYLFFVYTRDWQFIAERENRKTPGTKTTRVTCWGCRLIFYLFFFLFSRIPRIPDDRCDFPYFPIPVVKVSITGHIVVTVCLLPSAKNSFHTTRSILFLRIFSRSVKLKRNSINVIWYSKKSCWQQIFKFTWCYQIL